MPVEFLGIAATNDGSEITARSGASFDKDYTLELLLAHRPNVSDPTFAARTFATIDQISDGRVTVHFITGGTDHEQQREGDFLTHDERYARTGEYMTIVKPAWTSREPFDHGGAHYTFADGGGGNSNALAGPPDTVAQAILDYIDLGVGIISMRGYDLLADAVDVGREVIPIVRDEVAKRDRAVA